MPKVQVKVGASTVHIDWKAIVGGIALTCTFIVQQLPQFLGLPSVQSQPEEVKVLTLAVQIASGILLLLSEFKLLPGTAAAAPVAQDVAGQLNARPPAPASATTSPDLISNPEAK